MANIKRVALSILLFIIFMFSTGWLHAATISGTIQKSDSIPLTGEEYMSVRVFLDDPCTYSAQTGYEYVDTADGTYTINGLPAGTYYLRAAYTVPDWVILHPSKIKYAAAFWGAPDSPMDCMAAEPIQVSADTTLTGINIRLNRYATVSGSIFHEDGTTPFSGTSGDILLKQNQCDTSNVSATITSPALDSTFDIYRAIPGTYYLFVKPDGNFTYQWWKPSGSTSQCASAEAVTVNWGDHLSGMDIRMEAGATIAGTVYHRTGNISGPGTNVLITAYSGGSCETSVAERIAFANHSTGVYEVIGLPAGNYLLQARVTSAATRHEWWAEPLSVDVCADSTAFSLSHQQSLTGKDFQLAVKGDVNDDFRITMADPLVVLQIMSGIIPAPVYLEADLDQDGTLGIAEVIYHLQKLSYQR